MSLFKFSFFLSSASFKLKYLKYLHAVCVSISFVTLISNSYDRVLRKQMDESKKWWIVSVFKFDLYLWKYIIWSYRFIVTVVLQWLLRYPCILSSSARSASILSKRCIDSFLYLYLIWPCRNNKWNEIAEDLHFALFSLLFAGKNHPLSSKGVFLCETGEKDILDHIRSESLMTMMTTNILYLDLEIFIRLHYLWTKAIHLYNVMLQRRS